MSGSIAWLVLLLAPAATPEPESLRQPEGPTAVPAPVGVDMPRFVTGDEPPPKEVPIIAPAATPAADTPSSDPPILPEMVDDATFEDLTSDGGDSDFLPIGTNPRVPRVLATTDGDPADEQAYIESKDGRVVFVPGLQLRNQIGFVSPFTLDDEGKRFSEGAFTGGRLRWRPMVLLGDRHQVKLVAQIDVANGRWAPRETENDVLQDIIDDGEPPVPFDLRPVDPRELYVEWTTKVGQLRIGQMAFAWGQGLVANDGNNMDRFGDLKFGNDGDGGINERILFGTKPLAKTGGPGKDLIVAVGADLVYRDARASLVDGDLAGQGFLVFRWQPEERPANWIGAYAVIRGQRDADDGDVYDGDDELTVGVLDVAGQGEKKLRKNLWLVGAFEGVFVGGRTTFAADPGKELQVIQAAAAARGYIGNPATWLAGLDAGYASGDANPDDDEVNNFNAAPGFTAGLLLFQWVNGWQTARTQLQAENTELFGVPRNGTQYIPTKGSVTNVVFFHPKARYALLERAEVWGGPMFAAAPSPIVDPYTTTINGGAPKNARGGDGKNQYWGTELDLGVRIRHSYRNVWLMAGLQAGVLFPGKAFEDAVGDRDGPIWGTWFRTQIRY